MLGNNETYRAMMDEGFTQFLTAWGMEAIDGKTVLTDSIPKKKWYLRKFTEPAKVRDRVSYISYLREAMQFNDEPINTHSDAFNGALGQGGGYGMVYVKTATMLYNLQYVLGDSLFSAAMKHYVAQWKFAHPYPEDFRNSIIQFTHVDLNWFFDQWMETSKNIDYKIGRIKKLKTANDYSIRLKRKGRMQMPVDLQVISKKDSIYNYYIPNTWFDKIHPDAKDSTLSTDSSVHVLNKWYGWDKLQPEYEAVVNIPGGIKNVIIDPSDRLADINMLNNRKKGTTEFRFDSHVYPPQSWEKYRIYMRPDIWWNAFDGIKQAGWFSYRFDYSDAIDKVMRKTTFYFHSQWLDGLEMYKLGLSKIFPKNFSGDIHIKGFTRPKTAWVDYLLYPQEWDAIWTSVNKFNLSLNLSATYSYSHTSYNGFLTAHLRSGMLGTSFNYNYFDLTAVLKAVAWRFDFRTRFYGRAGAGNNVPAESALYLSGGNPEEMMDDKYYRSAGFAPPQWVGAYSNDVNHLQFGGGLNLRGYAGYQVAETDKNGAVVSAYKGPSGLGLNEEIDFNRIVKVKNEWLRNHFNLNTYLFGDMGSIAYISSINEQQLSSVRIDAGAGLAFTIKKWGPLQNIKPLTFRFDVPFFLNSSPYVSPDNFKFRWVVGIGRTF
jgi:aminopeptidase N